MHSQYAQRRCVERNLARLGRRRSGFTLVELLIVISIIGLLAGFLLVAVSNAFKAGRAAETVSEIKSLEAAIQAFETDYGKFPSSVILHETAVDWSTPPSLGSGDVVSSFPAAYDSSATGLTVGSVTTLGNIFQVWRIAGPVDTDLNADGDTDDSFILNGAECLVFFLGGHVTTSSGGEPVHYGFNFKAANPFAPPAISSAGLKKYFEFKSDRLDDYDGDGFFEYRDPTGLEDAAPYQFFRAGPLGYNLSSSGNSTGTLAGADGVFGTIDDETMTVPGSPAMPVGPLFPYYRTDSNAAVAANPTGIAWSADSFQIIAAGPDGQFGDGGEWSSESGVGGGQLTYPDNHPGGAGTAGGRAANFERDNIANFSGGTLN